jgi:hypothetical protein
VAVEEPALTLRWQSLRPDQRASVDDLGTLAYAFSVAAKSERGALEEGSSMEDAADPSARIEEILERVAQPSPSPEPAPEPLRLPGEPDRATSLRTARVSRITGSSVELVIRGRDGAVEATIDEGVDSELIARAMAIGDRVLVEITQGEAPVIVGVVQTRVPTRLELKAQDIVIEAEREVLIRSGRAAARLRQDGEVELVGSRILTASRGLFRIVGRVLRLN